MSNGNSTIESVYRTDVTKREVCRKSPVDNDAGILALQWWQGMLRLFCAF